MMLAPELLQDRLMRKPIHPQLGNIVFLEQLGQTLRLATKHSTQSELPEDIKHLLRRLERAEKPAAHKANQANDDLPEDSA
jgi:hypothetical protein